MMLVNHKAAARLCGCLGLALPSPVLVVFRELPVTADRLQGQHPSSMLHLIQGKVPFVQSQRNTVTYRRRLTTKPALLRRYGLGGGQSREVSVHVCTSAAPPHRDQDLGTLPIGHPVPSNRALVLS